MKHKFFESVFWIGVLLVFLSFVYPAWFELLSFGLFFMFLSWFREGLHFRKARNFPEYFRLNIGRFLFRFMPLLILTAGCIYLYFLNGRVYKVILRLHELLSSLLLLKAGAFIFIGLIFALFMIYTKTGFRRPRFQVRLKRKRRRKKPKKKKHRWWKFKKNKKKIKKTKKVKPKKPKHKKKIKFKWSKFKLPKFKLPKLKKKKKEKPKLKIKSQRIVDKKIVFKHKPEQSQLKKHRLAPRIMITLFMFAITIILILHKQGKFSTENSSHMAIIIGIILFFILYIIIGMLKTLKNKGPKKVEKINHNVLKKIKAGIIAKSRKYETDIDRLYKLVNKFGRVSITDVAKGFKVSREQAEDWAKILEGHGLIELNYPTIGDMQLCAKNSKNTK